MKWEYKVIKYREVVGNRSQERYFDNSREDHHPIRRDLSVDCLNLLGDDGWELVSYHPCGPGTFPVAIFKRPKNRG